MTRLEKRGMARLAFESFQYSLEDIILIDPEHEDTEQLTDFSSAGECAGPPISEDLILPS